MAAHLIDRMMNHFYFRTIVITTLMTASFTAMSLFGIVLLWDHVPLRLYSLVMYLVLFLNTFLFAEWLLSGLPRLTPRILTGAILLSFAWYLLLSLLVWSFFTDSNLFFEQTFSVQAVNFLIHAVAMGAAFYERTRMGSVRKKGAVEGLA